MASPSPHPSGWTRHVNQADGRPYWSHPQHGSSWTKPADLKTPLEREVDKTPWDEYETNGRKYWVHRDTKDTTWNMPREISDIIARFNAPPAQPTPPRMHPSSASPSFPHPPGGSASPLTAQTGALVAPGQLPPSSSGGGLPQRPAGAPTSIAAPAVYGSVREAEHAFKGMLARLGVDRTWSWEMVMKEAITDPVYRALATLGERKHAFEAFLADEERRERDEREQSLARCRKDWARALDRLGGGHAYEDGVKSWWSWERARRVVPEKCRDVWDMPRNDEERKILFDEYIAKLRAQEETRKRDLRGRNMDKLTAILQSLSLDLAGPVRWADARALVMRTPEWHRDGELQRIELVDMLAVFEDEVRRAEHEAQGARQKAAEDKRRRARKARDDFNALLQELVATGDLVAGSQWSQIYPLVSRDVRYLSLLGQPGSTPLDLFWDRVDELDVEAEEHMLFLDEVARAKGLVVGEETAEDEFVKALEGDERVDKMGKDAVKKAFERLHHRAVRAAKDARRRADKALRLAVDDLRYLFKKLDDPPVDVERDAFEAVAARADVQGADEWKALEGNDEARRSAWDKFVKRTKEKRAEREAAEQDRLERDRAYERQRDLEREQERAHDGGRGGRGARHDNGDDEGEHLPYDAGEGAKKRGAASGEAGDAAAREGDERAKKVPRLDKADGLGDTVMQDVGGEEAEEGEL
ncbi:uncharacterized protein JCM10292_006777 [Rhodotorula paludigena]|uniref:uncharacterized protein n=1 Tax=Rhodotorula paludigena TaxID=86838 RepID=UPI00317294BD